MSTMWQLSFPALNYAFSSMILFFAQLCTADEQLSSAGDHGYSSNTAPASSRRVAHLLLLLHFPFMFQGPSHTWSRSVQHLWELRGRGNLHAHPVICSPGPGPMEKGKAIALMCICTVLHTWGPVRKHAQFSSKLMLWLILLRESLPSIQSSLLWGEFPVVPSPRSSPMTFQLSVYK